MCFWKFEWFFEFFVVVDFSAANAIEGRQASANDNAILKVKISAPSLSVKIEADVAEQMPLFGVNLNLNGTLDSEKEDHVFKLFKLKFSKFKKYKILIQMKLLIKSKLEMAYFNESLALWEPVIEQCLKEDGTSEPWEIKLEVKKKSVKKLKLNFTIF